MADKKAGGAGTGPQRTAAAAAAQTPATGKLAEFPQSPPPPADGFRAADAGSIRWVLARMKEYRFDASLKKKREGYRDKSGNMHYFDYYEWHSIADALDELCPEWEHEVKSLQVVGDFCAVTVQIGIVGYEPDGTRVVVHREGIGTGTSETDTGIKKAEHDALKRAAIKFGLARDLYQEESAVIERTGEARGGGTPGKPREPLAVRENDFVTPKQMGMLRARAREAGVDADLAVAAEWPEVEGLNVERLTKKAASFMIDLLKAAQDDPSVLALNAEGEEEFDGAGLDEATPPMCECKPPKAAKLYKWDDAKGHHEVWACADRQMSKDKTRQVQGCHFKKDNPAF